MISYFTIMAMVFLNQLRVGSCGVSIGPTHSISVFIQEVQGWLREFTFGTVRLLESFHMYAERRDHEINMLHGGYPVSGGSPTNDEFYPISCLWCKRTSSILSRVTCRHIHFMFTSPIHVALRYFIINHQLPNKITADMVVQLPGDLKDRRTPLGGAN